MNTKKLIGAYQQWREIPLDQEVSTFLKTASPLALEDYWNIIRAFNTRRRKKALTENRCSPRSQGFHVRGDNEH